MAELSFSVADWSVFVALLLVSILIGIYFNYFGQNTTQSFLKGGDDMKLIPTAISMIVSFSSAISILGNPAEMYRSGTMYYLMTISCAPGAVLAVLIFVPMIYPLKIMSVYEYLEKRFNSKAARLTGTILLILQQIIYMGIASYAPSTALEAVTGFPTWATIILVGLVSTIYTFLGGMKAVVWTDVFQSLVMIAGISAVVIQGTISVGGLGEVWKINDEWKRIHFFDFNPDPTQRHSFWTLVIGGMIGYFGTYSVNQTSVQRYSALPTMSGAKKTVLLNIVGVYFLNTLTCLSGIVVFAYYVKKGCDPLTNKDVSNSNQIIPYFVMEKLNYPGLPGLFVACLFSGALSTMSSCLNALSAITWEDILKPFLSNKSEAQKTWITRFLVMFYGVSGVAFSFIAMNLGGTVIQAALSFTGAAGGPLFGLFCLAAFFPCANWIGAVIGSIVGLILPFWISIGAYSVVGTSNALLEFPTANCSSNIANTTIPTLTESMTTIAMTTTTSSPVTGIDKVYTLSYLYFSTIGVITVIVVGLPVSFITGPNKPADIDTKYLIPLFDRLFCCFPKSWLKFLRCNLTYKSPKEILREKDLELIVSPDEKDAPSSISNLSIKGDNPDSFENKIPVECLSYKPNTT